MQIFAKRFWGFRPASWPVVSFSLAGNRDALAAQSKAGDLIVFIGTQTNETHSDDRGKLLGLAEFGRIAVDTAEVVDPGKVERKHLDANGALRWPKSLPMLRAWRFVDRPRVTEVLERQLSYAATVRAVKLGPTDAERVSKLLTEEVPVPDVAAIRKQRNLHIMLGATGPTTGPRPSTWTGETGRNSDEESFTYAFQFGRRDLWKIGHAKSVKDRLADVNRHVPHEVLGEGWTAVLQHKWPTEEAAYEMEQCVLAMLRSSDSIGERVGCTKRLLNEAWMKALETILVA